MPGHPLALTLPYAPADKRDALVALLDGSLPQLLQRESERLMHAFAQVASSSHTAATTGNRRRRRS